MIKELETKKKQLQLIEGEEEDDGDDIFLQYQTMKTAKVVQNMDDITAGERKVHNNTLEMELLTRRLSTFTQGYLWSLMYILRIGNYIHLIDEYSNSKVSSELMIEVRQACNGAGDK